jgi:hypothetical protein
LNYELLRAMARGRIDDLLREAACRRSLALTRLPRPLLRNGPARAVRAVVRFAADLRMF